MRVVVTGGSGNVGTALLRTVQDDGDVMVGVSQRRPPQVALFATVPSYPIDLGGSDPQTSLRQACAGASAVPSPTVAMLRAAAATRYARLQPPAEPGIDAVGPASDHPESVGEHPVVGPAPALGNRQLA